MPIKKSKTTGTILQIQDFLKGQLNQTDFGETQDASSMKNYQTNLDITDSGITSITSSVLNDLQEVRQSSLKQSVAFPPVQSSSTTIEPHMSASSTCVLTQTDLVDAGLSTGSRIHPINNIYSGIGHSINTQLRGTQRPFGSQFELWTPILLMYQSPGQNLYRRRSIFIWFN